MGRNSCDTCSIYTLVRAYIQRYYVPGDYGLMLGGCNKSHLVTQILGFSLVQGIRMSYKIKVWGKCKEIL